MKHYYRMTTAQKDAVSQELIIGSPGPNTAGTEWILECTTSGLTCIEEFNTPQDCISYINSNLAQWDEFYDTYGE